MRIGYARVSTQDQKLDLQLKALMRIPVKWATDSGEKWARLWRAGRRDKDMMTEVAHMGQEESGKASSSRLHHFVSIVPFLRTRQGGSSVNSGKWATVPVMWATPGTAADCQAPAEPVGLRRRMVHSRSSVAAFRRM